MRSETVKTLDTLNNTIRTFLTLLLVGGLGYGGWYGYNVYNKAELSEKALEESETRLAEAETKLEATQTRLASAEAAVEESQAQLAEKDRVIGQQETQITALHSDVTRLEADVAAKVAEIKQQAEEIARLDTSLRLLKVDHRLARLTALDVRTDPDTGETISEVEFVELDAAGQPIDKPRTFRITGDMVYVDNWVVKFDDELVEQAALDRSTSLVLFRRIFGEEQTPADGYELDPAGKRPAAYAATGEMSEFERRIWEDFWEIANDKSQASDLGIRALHGEAVSIKVQKGRSYRLDLRASGGLSITVEDRVIAPTL